MGLFKRKGTEKETVDNSTTKKGVEMISSQSGNYYSWNGNLYQSDIIRTAIRPKVKHMGKTKVKAVREVEGVITSVQDTYLKMLLVEPNPVMSFQQFVEKMVTQLELNNNAFAMVLRDDNGLPIGLYPMNATAIEYLRTNEGNLYLRFTLKGFKKVTLNYEDVIHLRKDFNDDDLFGSPNTQTLTEIMEVVTISNQSIINAVKNSSIIRWLLEYQMQLKPEDLNKRAEEFSKSFLKTTNSNTGVAAIDQGVKATQIKAESLMVDDKQLTYGVNRVYSYFNTNEKIVNSTYTDEEFNSWYETAVEPDLIQLAEELTRKLFTRRQRALGYRIESDGIFITSKAKLGLVALMDRGVLNANEVRKVFNLPAIETGNEYIRRLDTATIETSKEEKE